MTDSTETTATSDTTVKAKATDIDRLEALVLKIAKGIVKNPLTEEVAHRLHSITSLIYSTVQHSQAVKDASKSTDASE